MKKNFGIWPGISLLLLLGTFLVNKFQVANHDLKAFKAERAALEAVHPQAPLATAPVSKPVVESHTDPSPVVPYEYQAPTLPVAYSQTDPPVIGDEGSPNEPTITEGNGGIVWFLKNNWAALLTGLLGFLEVIFRLTPSTKDNSVFNFIKFLLDKQIPNAKAGGGKHD